jgi:hypothetical protein
VAGGWALVKIFHWILSSCDEKKCTEMVQKTRKKCIILHVLGGISLKVHYNALFLVEVVVGEMGIIGGRENVLVMCR